jgi:hypothetical protein
MTPENVSRTVPLETLKRMVQRDTELRIGPEMQKLYRQYEDTVGGSNGRVEGIVLHRVLEEFGFNPTSKDEDENYKAQLAGYELRTAAAQYPDEPFFRTVPRFVKHNRAEDGPLQVGEAAPDVTLYTMALAPIRLEDLIRGNAACGAVSNDLVDKEGALRRPLFVVSGSMT